MKDQPARRGIAKQERETAWHEACRLDVAVFKPGNVSLVSPGHDMSAEDFLTSAAVSSPFMLNSELSVGARVLAAVRATRTAVGCNTNLGILLLAAPILKAAEQSEQTSISALRQALKAVLAGLTREDAADVYRAIAEAAPGGLGEVEAASVHSAPPETLLHGMALAQQRDRIAYEFVHDFAGVFALGQTRLNEGYARWQSVEAAVQWCFLSWLADTPDSHIARKYGKALAESVREEAARLASEIKACENPADFERPMANFDTKLKARKVNPGTTADLTVASTLVWWLCGRG